MHSFLLFILVIGISFWLIISVSQKKERHFLIRFNPFIENSELNEKLKIYLLILAALASAVRIISLMLGN